MVEALIAAGARVHRITNSGRTARDAARMNGHQGVVEALSAAGADGRSSTLFLLQRFHNRTHSTALLCFAHERHTALIINSLVE